MEALIRCTVDYLCFRNLQTGPAATKFHISIAIQCQRTPTGIIFHIKRIARTVCCRIYLLALVRSNAEIEIAAESDVLDERQHESRIVFLFVIIKCQLQTLIHQFHIGFKVFINHSVDFLRSGRFKSRPVFIVITCPGDIKCQISPTGLVVHIDKVACFRIDFFVTLIGNAEVEVLIECHHRTVKLLSIIIIENKIHTFIAIQSFPHIEVFISNSIDHFRTFHRNTRPSRCYITGTGPTVQVKIIPTGFISHINHKAIMSFFFSFKISFPAVHPYIGTGSYLYIQLMHHSLILHRTFFTFRGRYEVEAVCQCLSIFESGR